MRELKENRVTDTPLHLAKRELQRLLTSPKVWIGVLAVGLIAGLSGPFGTIDHLSPLPRLIYWILLSASAFFVGSGVGTFVHSALRPRLPDLVTTLAAGLCVGIVLTAILAAINRVIFGISPLDPEHLLGTFANVGVISLIVTVAFVAFDRLDETPDDTPETPRPADALLRRLPLEKRGPLLSLSATDHYVEVTTPNGSDLVLMRLSDAIELATGVDGLQVHRSHWVARAAVAGTRRDNGRLMLRLTDGRDIPVSRTYVSAVKDAGLTSE